MRSRRLWLSRKKWEQELDDELRFHIERQTAENIAAGIAPEEARRQAVLQLGAAEGVKEDCREQRRGFWLETLWADIRYGLRMLRKDPGLHYHRGAHPCPRVRGEHCHLQRGGGSFIDPVAF